MNFFEKNENKIFADFFSIKLVYSKNLKLEKFVKFVWNWFIAKMILISLKYLFRGYSNGWQIKQITLGLNSGLSSNIW